MDLEVLNYSYGVIALTRVARDRCNCKDRLLNDGQHKLLRVQGQWLLLVFSFIHPGI